MIDFIPLPLYTPIFNYFVLLMVISASAMGYTNAIFNKNNAFRNELLGGIILISIVIYMGLRPISGTYFGDTSNYAHSFSILQLNSSKFSTVQGGEWVFNSIMLWFAHYSNVHIFFLFCSAVYVGTTWFALRRIFGSDYFVPFIVVISMLSFWNYGVNGIRNGMAASLVILAFTFRQQLPVATLLCILAMGIHKSMMLLIGAAGLAYFIRNSQFYLIGWVMAIFISLTIGSVASDYLINAGWIEDERFAGYLNNRELDSQFSSTGFRWDFLVYSMMPIVVACYFIYKRNYSDKFYIWLFNIYLTANAFWIIVIRAAFSNRFAQLSWYLMPLILIYPFMMKEHWPDQEKRIGMAILAFYSFTFYFYIL